ncbi:MAG: formylglycine-generating enzyme family protein [Prevotella sp.]|jgi:formylglycine-generating enzyme required for sulfatase activity|nr:formylglycine-generating enzyme family protein [Prevotella sp.]
MKTRVFLLSALALAGMASSANAYVSYGNVNNYFLEFFTYTGYSSYDWCFEPLKTDKERAMLKGDVVKVVTDITDKTGRGFGEISSDTTYYNQKGQLTMIVAPKYDFDGSRSRKLAPSKWVFYYTPEGVLKSYENYEDVEMMNGHELRANAHFMKRNEAGLLISEDQGSYEQKGNQWALMSGGITTRWSFGYDANGSLVSGKFGNFALTYKDGRLTSMQEEGFAKPVTYGYDAQGRMNDVKFYSIDGMDEAFYYEDHVAMTYNQQGYLASVTKEQWQTTSKWVRKKLSYKTIYTITYTFDEKGNWTKAVMNSKTGTSPRTMAVTINRAITYSQQPAAGAGTQTSIPQDTNKGETTVAPVNTMSFNVNGVNFNMKLVKSGTFTMGKGANSLKVELTDDYYLSETEVTVALWNAVMRDKYENNSWPIEVRWQEAVDFCRRLRNLTGKNFRLPTEAEWEHAARYQNGNMRFSGSNTLLDTWNTVGRKSRAEGLNKPNFLGIYGMSNGVGEWCSDLYREVFPAGPKRNYQGPSDCEDGCGGHCRVVRAQGDTYFDNLAEVTSRIMEKDNSALNGFRICLTNNDIEEKNIPRRETSYQKRPVKIPVSLLGKRYGNKMYAMGVFDMYIAKELFPVEACDNKLGYGYLVSRTLQSCPQEFFLITKAVPVGTNAVSLTLQSESTGKIMTMKLTYFANIKSTTVSASVDIFNNINVRPKP